MITIGPKIHFTVVFFVIISFFSQLLHAMNHGHHDSENSQVSMQHFSEDRDLAKHADCPESKKVKSDTESAENPGNQNNDSTADHKCGDCNHVHCSTSFLANVKEISFNEIDRKEQFTVTNLDLHHNFQNSIYRPPIA